jgi:hypothetical protein
VASIEGGAVSDGTDDRAISDPTGLPPWLAAAWGEAEDVDLEWRYVDAARPNGLVRSMLAGRIDFPRLTYNDRFALGPMSVCLTSWGDADVVHARVLLDQVVRVSVAREALPPWDFGPDSGDAIVLELVDGVSCAPLALVDARRDVSASWVFLDTLLNVGIPVDDDVEALLDAPPSTSHATWTTTTVETTPSNYDGTVTTWLPEPDGEELWSLTGDAGAEQQRDRGQGHRRIWGPILAEPAVTQPQVAIPWDRLAAIDDDPAGATGSADEEDIDATDEGVGDVDEVDETGDDIDRDDPYSSSWDDRGLSRLSRPAGGESAPSAETWRFVTGHDERSRWQRLTAGGDRPQPLVYSSVRVVGPMACTDTDWSAAVIASREVLLDDVERITVEPGVLHRIDRRTATGDLVNLGTSSGDGVVLVLSSGERCAPLALAHDSRDVGETTEFITTMEQLAVPVDDAARRMLTR